jgi:HK97 family phage major capsid protein
MKKDKKSVAELISERNTMFAKREQINIRMNEISDKVQAENRPMTEAEEREYNTLQSDFAKLGRELSLNADMVSSLKNSSTETKTQEALLREVLAEAAKKGGKSEYVITAREWTAGIDMSKVAEGGMIPLTIKDILPPLEQGLIHDKVGIPIETGVVGDIQWPVLGAVEATVKGEKESLADTGIDMSKVVAKKVRVGITIPMSGSAITSTSTNLLGLIQSQAGKGIVRLLNRVIFSHQNFTSDFHGPFAGAKAQIAFAGAVPTYKELLQMKGKVMGTGIEPVGFCFVMSENMKSILEATPIDAGSGRMIVENGAINGYPVFTTEFINYGSNKQKAEDVEYIGAGCWGYLPVNQYDELRVIVDPYSRAKDDVVQITINGDWSITTLRTQAFALGVTKA